VSPRPRNWAPIDLLYFSQDTVEELLDRFGCDGPAVLLWLILEAHTQAHAGPRAKQGELSFRYAAIARRLRLDEPRAREIVAACSVLGLLDLDDQGARATARLLKWQRWEAKDLTAAERQARHRSGDLSREEKREEDGKRLPW
jgi:hypothetical protein